MPSAITKATPVADGVDVTITSRDVAAQTEIRARAALHASMNDWSMAVFPQHSGFHGGPGNIGYCPIIHADTLVSSEPIADGVRIHVKARNERDVRSLQTATDARVRALSTPTS